MAPPRKLCISKLKIIIGSYRREVNEVLIPEFLQKTHKKFELRSSPKKLKPLIISRCFIEQFSNRKKTKTHPLTSSKLIISAVM